MTIDVSGTLRRYCACSRSSGGGVNVGRCPP
jgi:hypothetical protein